MIYFCADDYGLCEKASMRIRRLIDCGALNKVSAFPNFDDISKEEIFNNKNLRISLHLNLVEGKCMADAEKLDLICDKNGNFKNTFGGLLKLNLICRKKFEKQIFQEVKAQCLYWRGLLPDGVPFCVDSHQHTHMIPGVFKALMRVIDEENIDVEYLRIPNELIMPFIKTPSLYRTYSGINVIKQWVLKALWLINKRYKKDRKIPTARFFGILFSGNMDEKRVVKILEKYKKIAEKDGGDIEVLFHPGYLSEIKAENVVFEKFYRSLGRRTEYDSLIKISKGSVF